MHSEWPKLYGALTVLSAIGLSCKVPVCVLVPCLYVRAQDRSAKTLLQESFTYLFAYETSFLSKTTGKI